MFSSKKASNDTGCGAFERGEGRWWRQNENRREVRVGAAKLQVANAATINCPSPPPEIEGEFLRWDAIPLRGWHEGTVKVTATC